MSDPKQRPTPTQLLSHPFFALSDVEEEGAIRDAKAYGSGAAPVQVMVQQKVMAPLQALVKESALLSLKQQKLDMAMSVGAVDDDGHEAMFDVGSFCDILNSAASFLHGGGEATQAAGANSGKDDSSRVTSYTNWSASERQHAAELMFSDEVVKGGVLPRIVACTLRFISSDQASATGYDIPNSAAVGGSATATLGQRLMTRIARFFESVLLETRPMIAAGSSSSKEGSVAPFAGNVLEALCMLYLGEEAPLAKLYGRGDGMKVDFSGFGGSNLSYADEKDAAIEASKKPWAPFGRASEGLNHWSPSFMAQIEPVLLLAITESGSGNHLYTPICDYILAAKGKIEGSAGGDAIFAMMADEEGDEEDLANTLVNTTTRPFLRTSAYFGELVGVGRTLANLSAASRGEGRTGARARRSCVSYILTMVRLWGLKEGGGKSGNEGLSARPDSISSMQRAQLLLDVRVAAKLLPYACDFDSEVRRDVLTSAYAALTTGLSLLTAQSSSSFSVANPHAELALEFCKEGWCQVFAHVLTSGNSNKDDSACRVLAGQCLQQMASAGDVACGAWESAAVIGSLGIALSDNRKVGSKEGALGVFECLAGSSAPTIGKLLHAHPGIHGTLSGVGVSMPPPLSLPMLSQRGLDLAKGHTMAEIQQLVSMSRSLIATAAQMDDIVVLGDASSGRPPEALIKLIGQIFGWFEVYWRKTVLSINSHAQDSHEIARTHVLRECVDLFEFLVSGGVGDRGTWLLDVAPDAEVVRMGGMKVGGELSSEQECEQEVDEEGYVIVNAADTKRRGRELTKRLLLDIGMGLEEAGLDDEDDEDDELSGGVTVASSGLNCFVNKIGKNRGGGNTFEAYQADKLVKLKTKILHAVASGLSQGGPKIGEKLLNCGVALYFGEAMHAGAMLVKNSINSGSEHIHLATTYAEACAARQRMWESLLMCRSVKCAEQVLLSGVCELIVGVMLRDEKAAEITNVVIDLGFAPFNGKRLSRNEAISMIVASKRGARGGGAATAVSKAVVGEFIRQLRKYDTVAQERESLWRLGGGGKGLKAKDARGEVIKVMRALLSLRSSELVREIQFIGGVKTELLEMEVALWNADGVGNALELSLSKKKEMAKIWVKWAKDQAEQYDDVRYGGGEGENADSIFKVDNDLRELLLVRGGKQSTTGLIKQSDAEPVVLGESVHVAVSSGVMSSMEMLSVSNNNRGKNVTFGGVDKSNSGSETEAGTSGGGGGLLPQIVSSQTAPTTQQQAQQQTQVLLPPPPVLPTQSVPSKRLTTLKIAGPPERLSLQKLLNTIANDVGCDDCEMAALSVRRGVTKSSDSDSGSGSGGEATIVEISASEVVANSIHTRARAGAFMKGGVGGLEFVSVEVQGMGRIDNKGNEVFGSIDDDMNFDLQGQHGANSMSGGVSNFATEAPLNTYVENLRRNRDRVNVGNNSNKNTISNRASIGREASNEPAALPLILDRLGGALSELRAVFDARSSSDIMSKSDVLNGLLDLRVDPVLAREALRRSGGLSELDFGAFVALHAKIAGYDGSKDQGGNGNVNLPGEMWVESGNSGTWVCLAAKDVAKLRRGFDNAGGGERGRGVDSDSAIFGVDKLKEGLFNCGIGGLPKPEVDAYVSSRGHVLGVTDRGVAIVGFQEFARCWLEFGGSFNNIDERNTVNRGMEGEDDMYDEYSPSGNRGDDNDDGFNSTVNPLKEGGWRSAISQDVDEDEVKDEYDDEEERYANLSKKVDIKKGERAAGSSYSEASDVVRPAYTMGGGSQSWVSKQQALNRSKATFKGGERSLLGETLEGRRSGDQSLRDELKARALKKGFDELSNGESKITMPSLRLAMSKNGSTGGREEDLALQAFIESRGGNVRDGLSRELFETAYLEGRGGGVGGSMSLGFVDGETSEALSAGGKAKKVRGRRGEEEEEEDYMMKMDDDEVDDLVVDEFTEEAIKKTFSMYDLNSDGVISYLELKTCFQNQGRDSSDYEIRNWIRSRDTTGLGSVTFEDFRKAYLKKSR